MKTIKATKTSLYKLVSDYIQLPKLKQTWFRKYTGGSAYWLGRTGWKHLNRWVNPKFQQTLLTFERYETDLYRAAYARLSDSEKDKIISLNDVLEGSIKKNTIRLKGR